MPNLVKTSTKKKRDFRIPNVKHGSFEPEALKKNTVNLWFMTSNPKLGRFFFSHPTNIDNIAKAKATSSGHSLLLSPTKKVVV